MSNIKQDLSTYKELKNVKSNFDKEIKKVKTSIKKNSFGEAKAGLGNCDKYITNMEAIIDKLPDKSTVDVVKTLVPAVTTILGATLLEVFNNVSYKNKIKEIEKSVEGAKNDLKTQNDNLDHYKSELKKVKKDLHHNLKERDKYYDNLRETSSEIDYSNHVINNIKKAKFNEKTGKYDHNVYGSISKEKLDRLENLWLNKNKELRSRDDRYYEEYLKYKKEVDRLNGIYDVTIDNVKEKLRSKKIDTEIIKSKDDRIKKEVDDKKYGDKLTAVASLPGVTATLISLKPLKSKAKTILNRCKKVLDDTRKYLDKVEKMSKAVKESFDETLDSIYEAFTEGVIDEFEYDTLMDHLLN